MKVDKLRASWVVPHPPFEWFRAQGKPNWLRMTQNLVGVAIRQSTLRTKRAVPRDWFGGALRSADWLLRCCMGIEEFCTDEACIIRVALRTADRDLCLEDGTGIRKGDVIGEIHLWNEHLPRALENETAMAWALEIRRLFTFSFVQLTHYIETDPRFASVRAFRGGIAFANQTHHDAKVARVMGWFGIETLPSEPALFKGLREFGHALFTLALIRAFHLRGSFGAVRLRRQYHEVWLSRRVLFERYADTKRSPSKEKAAAMQKGAA